MDDAGTLRSLPALLVCPGLHLHFACGDEGLQVQKLIGLLDEAVHPVLLQAELFQEQLLVLVRFQLSDILFRLGGDDHRLSTLFLGQSLYLLGKGIAALRIGLTDVADVQHRLGSEQEEVTGTVLFVLRLELYHTGIFPLIQCLFVSLQYADLNFGVFVAGGSGFLRLGQAPLDSLQVFQLKLRIDDFLVADGVDGAVDVGDVIIFETAQHMDDGVRLADVS